MFAASGKPRVRKNLSQVPVGYSGWGEPTVLESRTELDKGGPLWTRESALPG